MRWYIRGAYHGETETIDECDTRAEALCMIKEYRLAYGADWVLWCTTRCPPDWTA